MIRKPSLGRRLRRKLWKFSKWCAAFVAFAVACGYGYVRYDYSTAASDYSYQFESAKKNGLILDVSQMGPTPPVSASENAAPLYRKAFSANNPIWDNARHNQNNDSKNWVTSSTFARCAVLPGVENFEVAKDYIKKNHEVFELAKEAALKPRCDFQRKWSDGISIDFSEYSGVNALADLLRGRAVFRAKTGDVDGSVSDIEAILRMPKHVEEDRVLIGGLVGIAVEHRGILAIEECTEHLANDPAALKKYERLLTTFSDAPDPFSFLKSEAFFGFQLCSSIGKLIEDERKRARDEGRSTMGFGMDDNFIGIPNRMILPPLIETELCEKAYAAKCLRFWNEAFGRFANDRNAKLHFANYLDAASLQFSGSSKPSDQLNNIIFPVFNGYGNSLIKRSQKRKAAKILFQVLEYKRQHGSFPKSLQQAGIDATEDYGKTTIAYTQVANGFRLYDIGIDNQDDGGKFSYEYSRWEGNDDQILICYPSSQRMTQSEKNGPSRDALEYFKNLKETETSKIY